MAGDGKEGKPDRVQSERMEQNVQARGAMLLQPHDDIAIDISSEGCLKVAASVWTT